jgi:hypothetical protein
MCTLRRSIGTQDHEEFNCLGLLLYLYIYVLVLTLWPTNTTN